VLGNVFHVILEGWEPRESAAAFAR
jgi:hypothetical protein